MPVRWTGGGVTVGLALLSIMGCTTTPIAVSVQPHEAESCCALRPTGTAIAQTAGSLVGASVIELNGQRIAYDCAGVARAIYLAHGIDLYEGRRADSEASGVRTIYAHLSANGLIHRGPRASPGDLVFFDNTWDANSDGLINDALTHVGVVERTEPDGTVVFISRVAEAVERYRMNLALPHIHKTADGRILNDYIRRKRPTDPEEMGHLAGELFTFYGTRLAQ